jgi:hypothetical protein
MKKIKTIIILFFINSINYGIIQPSVNSEDSIIKNKEDLTKIKEKKIKFVITIGLIIIGVPGILYLGWKLLSTEKIKGEPDRQQEVLNGGQNKHEEEVLNASPLIKDQDNQLDHEELFNKFFQNLGTKIKLNEKKILYEDPKNFRIEIHHDKCKIHPYQDVYYYNIYYGYNSKIDKYNEKLEYNIFDSGFFIVFFYKNQINNAPYKLENIQISYIKEACDIISSHNKDHKIKSLNLIEKAMKNIYNLLNNPSSRQSVEREDKNIDIFAISLLDKDKPIANPTEIIKALEDLTLCN